MSKADELLRAWVEAIDEHSRRTNLLGKESPETIAAIHRAEVAARAWDDERHEAGCPNAPHAAAEPEKPMDTDQVNAAYAAYSNAPPPAAEPEKPMSDAVQDDLAKLYREA